MKLNAMIGAVILAAVSLTSGAYGTEFTISFAGFGGYVPIGVGVQEQSPIRAAKELSPGVVVLRPCEPPCPVETNPEGLAKGIITGAMGMGTRSDGGVAIENPNFVGDARYEMLGSVLGSPGTIRHTSPAIGKFDFSVMTGVGERVGDGMVGGALLLSRPCDPPCRPPPCTCPPCPLPFGVVRDMPEVSWYEPTDERWRATGNGMTIGSTVQNNDEHASVQVGYRYASSKRVGDFTVEIPHEYPTGDIGYGYDLGGHDFGKLPPMPYPVPPPLPRFRF